MGTILLLLTGVVIFSDTVDMICRADIIGGTLHRLVVLFHLPLKVQCGPRRYIAESGVKPYSLNHSLSHYPYRCLETTTKQFLL